MALQHTKETKESIETEIIQSNSNDIDSMYDTIKLKIDEIQNTTDLFLFIHQLMTVDQLKKDLQSSLDKQHKSAVSSNNKEQQNKANTIIRSLFQSLNDMNTNINNKKQDFAQLLEDWKWNASDPHNKKTFNYLSPSSILNTVCCRVTMII